MAQIAGHAGAGDSKTPRLKPHDLSSNEDAAPVDSMLLDQRYFLEMVDVKHRYGTNLQVYHEEWLRSISQQAFFDWLDRGEGRLLSLPGGPREQLERERVRYLSKDERNDYLVCVDDTGHLRWSKNDELITTSAEAYRDSVHGIVTKDAPDPAYSQDANKERYRDETRLTHRIAAARDLISKVADAQSASDSDDKSDWDSECMESHLDAQPITKERRVRRCFHVSPATILNHLMRATVKPGTWIYVADTVGRLYVGIKSSGAFQHNSFLAGARISSAGLIGIELGQLTYLSPLSGHYRPTTKSFKAFVSKLKDQGVDLSHVKVSQAYQILLGMEYYGKTKSSVSKMLHHGRPEDARALAARNDVNMSATEQVEQHWQAEHRHGLVKLMDDLHIRRQSVGQKREHG